MLRRSFLVSGAATAVNLAAVQGTPRVKLGVDLFSMRSQGWTPFQYLDYCAEARRAGGAFQRDPLPGQAWRTAHLKRVREHAERLGIEVEIGMLSICPTSKFEPRRAPPRSNSDADDPSARTSARRSCGPSSGSSADRTGAIPIEGHIENTVRVLRAVRSRAWTPASRSPSRTTPATCRRAS